MAGRIRRFTLRIREDNRLFVDFYVNGSRVKRLLGIQLSQKYSLDILNQSKLNRFEKLDQELMKNVWELIPQIIQKTSSEIWPKPKINSMTLMEIAERYILNRNFTGRSSSSFDIKRGILLFSNYIEAKNIEPTPANISPKLFYDFLLARLQGSLMEDKRTIDAVSARTAKLNGQYIVRLLKESRLIHGNEINTEPYSDILSHQINWKKYKTKQITEARSLDQIKAFLFLLRKESKGAFETTLFHLATGIDHAAMFYNSKYPTDACISGKDIYKDDFGYYIEYERAKTDVITYKRIPDMVIDIMPHLVFLMGKNIPLFRVGSHTFRKDKTYNKVISENNLPFQFKIKNIRKSIATIMPFYIKNPSFERVIASMYLGHTQKEIRSIHYTDYKQYAEVYSMAMNSIISYLLT